MKEQSPRMKLILSVLVALAVGLAGLLGFTDLGASDSPSSDVTSSSATSRAAAASATSGAAAETAAPRGVTPVQIPPRAYETLAEIDNGGWPDSANAPGTKGGLTWQNRGGDLPKTEPGGNKITYQEWDVNPKQRGQGRDAERIVTGSDGSAWYTGDHYTSFIRMR